MEIKIGEKLVKVVKSDTEELTCADCCFANHHRASRSCPKISYLGNEMFACMIFGDLAFFIEV